jgi:hypothetical protein
LVGKKYIYPNTIEECIQSPRKSIYVSIIWKAVFLAFPLIGNWRVWNVGNGKKVEVDEYPWRGLGEDFRLLTHMIQVLRERGYFYLSRIINLEMTIILRQEWKQGYVFGFVGTMHYAYIIGSLYAMLMKKLTKCLFNSL